MAAATSYPTVIPDKIAKKKFIEVKIFDSWMSHDLKELKREDMKFVKLTLLLLSLTIYRTQSALPQFSWDTLPVFFHSSNSSGLYNHDALQIIAKYQMATIEKWMGYDDKDIDDEDEMVLAMKAIKDTNPKISTYFYMNSYKARPEMTRMARELDQHPDYALQDENGDRVKNSQGFYVFDLSKPEVRKWWLNICLNATKYANGDGCFCDSSQNVNSTFTPELPASKTEAWGEGLLNLTREVQEALGDDNLLIGKVANQSYVKAVQIEGFRASNGSIESLLLGSKAGQVMQAHVPVGVPCASDLTNYIAAFLIGAGEYAYFGCGGWHAEGDDTKPLTWRSEYDKPLGAPNSSAKYRDGVWTRSFASGTEVTFDTKENKGTIKWGGG